VKISSIRLWLAALLVASALPAAGGEALVARVTPMAGFAPSDVTIQAFVERDDRNRMLEFVIESGTLYASSAIELDGDRAPVSNAVRFRTLPAGQYEVRITLIGTGGERGQVVRYVELL
jgi:hypothetical protein